MLYFNVDWSEIHFLSKLSLPVYVSVFIAAGKKIAFTWLDYTCEEALGSKVWWKYYRWGRERSIKEAEKNPSAAVVAGVRSTGATVVGSVNATEFWQMRTRSPSFLLLLSRKMDLAIPQWSTLHPGSQMIYYHIVTIFVTTTFVLASFIDVLYSIRTTSNETEAVPIK